MSARTSFRRSRCSYGEGDAAWGALSRPGGRATDPLPLRHGDDVVFEYRLAVLVTRTVVTTLSAAVIVHDDKPTDAAKMSCCDLLARRTHPDVHRASPERSATKTHSPRMG